jgi:hypothetical protein
MKNYCGKDCETCVVREAENCPGCQHIADFGECEIASCCKEKGHECCLTCTQRTWCPTVRKAVSMHKYRREKAETEAENDRRNREIAGLMVKWCVPLFWCMIFFEGIGLIAKLFENSSSITLIFSGVSVLLYLAESFFLFRMRPAADRYGNAALFTLLTAVFSGISSFLSAGTTTQFLTILIALPGAILSYLSVYHTYTAHSDAVTAADGDLAEKWEKLWKWTIYALIGMFLAVPLSAVLGIIGLLLLLAVMIATVVCGVLKLVYLYRMIDVFRWYQDNH